MPEQENPFTPFGDGTCLVTRRDRRDTKLRGNRESVAGIADMKLLTDFTMTETPEVTYDPMSYSHRRASIGPKPVKKGGGRGAELTLNGVTFSLAGVGSFPNGPILGWWATHEGLPLTPLQIALAGGSEVDLHLLATSQSDVGLSDLPMSAARARWSHGTPGVTGARLRVRALLIDKDKSDLSQLRSQCITALLTPAGKAGGSVEPMSGAMAPQAAANLLFALRAVARPQTSVEKEKADAPPTQKKKKDGKGNGYWRFISKQSKSE